MIGKANCLERSARRMGGAVALSLLLMATHVAFAQLPTATILGVVKDSTGAIIPAVSVTARNVETGQSRTTVSGGDGSYRFSALPVGNYEIRVEAPGFQSAVRRGLTLTVAQEAVVDFTLEVGAVQQTIEVTAEAPLVSTTSGSLGGLVNEQKVSDLPLNGRNFIDLTLLQTGITYHRNISDAAIIRGTWFSSSGAPPRSNNFLLDGALMQNAHGGSTSSVSGTTLGVEGIREYRVVSNAFSAEYGMTMGSQTVMVSKNGTNEFHGSLFEYLRNSALNARNFFDYKTVASNRRLPAFTKNNFGGSLGGPIKKDKTFFHIVYEGLRERLGLTQILTTISPSAKVDGGLVPVISPVVKPFLALYPAPNLPANQFTYPFNVPVNEDYEQVRMDQNFSSNDSLFGRYTISDADRRDPVNYPQFVRLGASRSQYATLSETHIFSPTLLSTFRFSYSRTMLLQTNDPNASGPNSSEFLCTPESQRICNMGIGGISTVGTQSGAPQHIKQNIFTWSDDVFYTLGRHSLKFGVLGNHYQQFLLVSTFAPGNISFANLAAFLEGKPSSYNVVTPGSRLGRTYHYTTLGFYLQDDLRVSSNLTLNLGLRYEFHTTFEEVRGLGAALRDVLRDADTTLGPPFKNPSLKNLGPRFGFAWDVRGNGMTAVRGGFGVLHDVGNLASALIVGNNSVPPFAGFSTVQNPPAFTIPMIVPPAAAGRAPRLLDYTLKNPHLLQYNLTVERQLPFDMGLTVSYAGSRGMNLIRTHEGNPAIPQFLPDGRKFWATGRERRVNPAWTFIDLKTSSGDSWYNSFQLGVAKRLSKGLQFQSSYTWSKAIDTVTQGQLQVDATTVGSYGPDPWDNRTDRAVAGYDTPHNWRFNTIYRLPELAAPTGMLGKVLNGWWVSGILSLQTGYPFTVALQTNRSRSQVAGGMSGIDRPDLVANRTSQDIVSGVSAGCLGATAGRELGGPDLYYDPCAFTIPTAGFLGTAGRNILLGPGFANLDFSLVKDTALGFLGESGKLEFRAEFFNILNRANFGTPNRTVYAARSNVEAPLGPVGRITDTANTSRQIQLALKILF